MAFARRLGTEEMYNDYRERINRTSKINKRGTVSGSIMFDSHQAA
jgi:hypothetical protein